MDEYRVPEKEVFQSVVDRCFGFLVTEHGFTSFDHEKGIQKPGMYLSFGFRNNDVELWVENDRGCFDLIIRLIKEVPWLRPYMSKMFSLHELVSQQEMDQLREQLSGVTHEENCRITMETYAKWLKGLPVIKGDYGLLEKINQSRQ